MIIKRVEIKLLLMDLLIYQIFNLKIIENATKISVRSKGQMFLGSKLFGLKHLGKNRNLESPEKLSLIVR